MWSGSVAAAGCAALSRRNGQLDAAARRATSLSARKFFVDTADIADIKEMADTGLLDGVTTNPSLIAKSGRDFMEVTAGNLRIVDGPVSAKSSRSIT